MQTPQINLESVASRRTWAANVYRSEPLGSDARPLYFAACASVRALAGRIPRQPGLRLWPPHSRAHVNRLGFFACSVSPSPGGVSVSRIIHAVCRRPGILCPGAHSQQNAYAIQPSKALPGNHFEAEYTPCRLEKTMVSINNSRLPAVRSETVRVEMAAARHKGHGRRLRGIVESHD